MKQKKNFINIPNYYLWYLKTFNYLLDYSNIFESKHEALKMLKKIIATSTFLNIILDEEKEKNEIDFESSIILLKIGKNLDKVYKMFNVNICNQKYLGIEKKETEKNVNKGK